MHEYPKAAVVKLDSSGAVAVKRKGTKEVVVDAVAMAVHVGYQ